MENLLAQVGGTQVVIRTVDEFYQTIGRHLSSFESCDHKKQQSRQSQFLTHAFSAQPEPVHSARANFLAQGLNPALFEALLEYIEGRLMEMGFSYHLSNQLVETAGDLYYSCDQDLSIAC